MNMDSFPQKNRNRLKFKRYNKRQITKRRRVLGGQIRILSVFEETTLSKCLWLQPTFF